MGSRLSLVPFKISSLMSSQGFFPLQLSPLASSLGLYIEIHISFNLLCDKCFAILDYCFKENILPEYPSFLKTLLQNDSLVWMKFAVRLNLNLFHWPVVQHRCSNKPKNNKESLFTPGNSQHKSWNSRTCKVVSTWPFTHSDVNVFLGQLERLALPLTLSSPDTKTNDSIRLNVF